jgi:hypothetical protein
VSDLQPTIKLQAEGFNQKIRAFQQKARGNRERVGRQIFFELLKRVILKTPVDTGRARGGWGAGAEVYGIRIPQGGGRGADGRFTSGGAGAAEGRALSEYTETTTGTTIRLRCVNNVVYIVFLEHGSSDQAPIGMVRISMMEVEQMLGQGNLPGAIAAIYQQTWESAGLAPGSIIRQGVVAAAGLAQALRDVPGGV